MKKNPHQVVKETMQRTKDIVAAYPKLKARAGAKVNTGSPFTKKDVKGFK